MFANATAQVAQFFQTYGVLAVLAVILAVGILRIAARLLTAQRQARMTRAFRERFHAFANSTGEDRAAYERMSFLAPRLVKAMGPHAALDGKPPFAGRSAKAHETVLQFIPELRMHFSDLRGGGYGIGNEGASWIYHNVDDALIGFLAALDDTAKSSAKKLINPVAWFREGVERILALPFLVLGWAGAIEPERAAAAERHLYFRVVAGLAAIVVAATIVSVLTIGEARTAAVYRDAFGAAGRTVGGAARATYSAFADVANAITAPKPAPQPNLPQPRQ